MTKVILFKVESIVYLCQRKQKSKMTTTEKQQLDGFNAAKKIALNIGNNLMIRARVNDSPANYSGAKINGRMFVIGDSENDIQNPDTTIFGRPAREIFGDFTIMR